MQPPGDADRSSSRRARWLLGGSLLLVAGTAWPVRVTYGPPTGWTGPAAAIRYSKPAVWLALVGAAICFYRAGRK